MYEIIYHEDVVKKDIPKLSNDWRKKIRTAIESKLTIQPSEYGKPLRRSLKNYLKLRVGDYRVIFRIEGDQVKILVIQHRSQVYSNPNNRL